MQHYSDQGDPMIPINYGHKGPEPLPYQPPPPAGTNLNMNMNMNPYPPAAAQPVPRIRGVVRDILIAFAVSTLPMIAFSCILLGLVFHYRVTPNNPVAEGLGAQSRQNDNGVIFVKLSATTLTTVASWSSTIAPLVVPFILTLASFPVARVMIRLSGDGDSSRKPTPYQLTLMLRILCNASLGTVWQCISYISSPRAKKAAMTSPVAILMRILHVGTIISMLVFVTDTWLHFTTKTVALTLFEPMTYANASFILDVNCTNMKNSFQSGCTLNPAAANTFVMNGDKSLQLLSNISSLGMVQRMDDHGAGDSYAFLGIPPSDRNANVDYRAQSWAVKTQCQPVTTRCIKEDDIHGPSAKYKCDFAMEGDIATTKFDTIMTTYFTDSSLSENASSLISMPNPYYFGAVVSVNQNLGSHDDLRDDPEITNGLHGSTLFALLCNVTVFDWTYSSVNGSVTNGMGSKSNSSTTNVVMGTQAFTSIGDMYITPRTSLDVWESHTAQEVADKFAYAYSQTALAAAGAAFVPRPAVEAQLRSSILVARVPKAPLGCLLAANLMLVVLGVLMAIIAFLSLNDDVGDVQARLDISALVAALFERGQGESPVEQIDDLFEERQGVDGPRIGVERTSQGGWILASRSDT